MGGAVELEALRWIFSRRRRRSLGVVKLGVRLMVRIRAVRSSGFAIVDERLQRLDGESVAAGE